jgi:hypothetical protein
MIQLLDLDCEKGDCAFLGAFIVNLNGPWIGLDVDGHNGRREEVEKVAQRGSESETVPDCIHDFCRTAERACRGGERKKVGKTMDSKET